MATRSRIGIQIGNDVLSAYHHWDGYPDWLGRVLKTHYNTKEKVAELIDGGDMSLALGDDNRPEYHADRREHCPPSYISTDEYFTKDNNEEYAYVFTSAGWTCYDMNEFDDSKQPEQVEISDVPYYLPAA